LLFAKLFSPVFSENSIAFFNSFSSSLLSLINFSEEKQSEKEEDEVSSNDDNIEIDVELLLLSPFFTEDEDISISISISGEEEVKIGEDLFEEINEENTLELSGCF
jgi:hypothetical protein